jgi:hypothetical protein
VTLWGEWRSKTLWSAWNNTIAVHGMSSLLLASLLALSAVRRALSLSLNRGNFDARD